MTIDFSGNHPFEHGANITNKLRKCFYVAITSANGLCEEQKPNGKYSKESKGWDGNSGKSSIEYNYYTVNR